ncbi:lytic transglycosylase domain-containing protein [Sphingomonas sp. PR090111-T3T-6A]|uniref:lytic transglycosylase domain-containing protein n=1 Tax=Sphingomonas sp. PR090111-T3T-6A TaxID=685778 RepID=UPI001F2272D3|nr:lytic transglycosylase domain-containing protein [Sphingomonas sp. PR090111-T3T-6A]
MLSVPALLLAATAAASVLTPQQVAWYRAQLGLSSASAVTPPSPSAGAYAYAPAQAASTGLQSDPVAEGLVNWKRLRQSNSLLFQDYSSFLLAHPGWPGEAQMRRLAENAIQPDVTPPESVIAFLTRFPPQTGAGQLRLAEALYARGRAAEAQAAARAAWTSGAINTTDEARIMATFSSALTQADQDQRMEALLWNRAFVAAQRQLPLTSPARRAIFSARLAYQLKSPDAATQAAALGTSANGDAGYLIDRINWLRQTGQEPVARFELAQPHRLTVPAFNPTRTMETLLSVARSAAADQQWAQAYGIASQLTDIYPVGTSVRALPFAPRDVFTSLSWLAGTTALQHLSRASDAVAMFRAYADASQSPGSRSKGYYWAGRAALAAGDQTGAQGYFANAAAFPDQFYGQLALERLGKPVPAPLDASGVQVPEADGKAFEAREVVRAARILGQLGDWQDQSLFLRTIAADSQLSDSEHVLIARLARDLGRPDLGVMAERAAKPESASDYVRSGFPVLPVPPEIANSFSFIHGIMRQESQFDREAISRTGARGMMQLMPVTAREQSEKLGLPYDYMRLTSDPGYNMELGTAYFGRIMDMFSGNYVLALAAYNAGPGNVRRWIATYGDPRSGGVDPVDWIEAIPFSETRGYVQNVLENVVVYDTINPLRAGQPNTNRLSYYLNKQTPG